MTETHSKSRQQAEIAFGNTQTQFFAKDKAVEELLSVAQSREAKRCGFVRHVFPENWRIAPPQRVPSWPNVPERSDLRDEHTPIARVVEDAGALRQNATDDANRKARRG